MPKKCVNRLKYNNITLSLKKKIVARFVCNEKLVSLQARNYGFGIGLQ